MIFPTLRIGIVVLICIVIAGCGASMPAEPLREVLTFSYTPKQEAAPGSGNVTFAVVGTQLGTPARQVQAPFQVPVPLLKTLLIR